MTRQRTGLRAPRGDDVAGVPTTWRRRPLYRAVGDHYGQPWWYSTRTANPDPGRFDLLDPHGTCYWALSPAAAIIEKTTDPDQAEPAVLTIGALGRLTVWEAADVPAARSKLADTTRPSVPGLTAEIATIVPYALPWAWADGFHSAGRNGIVYYARFAMDESVALFGDAGIPAEPPAAAPSAAMSHFDRLPAGFRAGVGTVGDLETLERAPAP